MRSTRSRETCAHSITTGRKTIPFDAGASLDVNIVQRPLEAKVLTLYVYCEELAMRDY